MLSNFFRILSRGKLTILLFHKVPEVKSQFSPADLDLAGFERVLLLVMRIFRVIPFEEALLGLRAGNLPPRSACITFDDGYPDWLRGVVPLLESKNIHATFFITTGQFKGLPMWNERIYHAVANAPIGTQPLRMFEPDSPPISFDGIAQRRLSIEQLDRYLKYEDPSAREKLLRVLELHTGYFSEQVPSMSTSELRDLHARGFGIGGHAVTHPILSRCAPDDAYAEIGGAREELEMLIKGKVTAFAYPNGVPVRDFGVEHIEMVKRAGYSSAVTTYRGTATANTSMFQIPRFTPWGPTDAKRYLQIARNLIQRPRELDEAINPDRRALMVAFHFPPQAGSSGILRTLNFVKYLPKQGWGTSVLTVSPRAFEEQRNDLVSSIPAQSNVVRATAFDAARHFSIKGKYPRVFALPDRWSSWWLPAVWIGMKEIRRSRPKLIWSTYPISTAHLIGGSLSRLSGLPWVADFRDPMVSPAFPSDKTQRIVWGWLEASVMRRASACVFTTESAAQEYRQRYPEQAAKCYVIENGYDDEAFDRVVPSREGVADDKLLMLHSGLIYPKDRDPSTFFSAIRQLIEEGHLDDRRLCIRFRAPQHGEEVMECATRYGLAHCVEVGQPIPYHRAISEMMGSDILLVFQGSNFNTQIPAKIYEYLRSERPILAVVDPRGGTAAQLGKFEAVQIADIHDKYSIHTALLGTLCADAHRDQADALAHNRRLVMKFSRNAQTERLGLLFDRVAGLLP